MAKEQRLVFGEVADLYDRARPGYPPELIDHLVSLIPNQGKSRAPGRVLDVGCGTGKATVALAARELTGVGLEPDPAMAAAAERNLSAFGAWSVVVTDFEDYSGNRAAPFDLITCAQAWHWLDPAQRFQRAASLLRPQGWLALFWNRTGDDSSPLRRDVDAVYAQLFPGLSPHGTLTIGHPPAGAPAPEAGFGRSSWRVFPWVRRYSAAEWTDLAQTHSDHRLIRPDQREVLLARVAEVIDSHGGFYDHPYECWLWTAQLDTEAH
jgi:SAM-dependent methyltransferase